MIKAGWIYHRMRYLIVIFLLAGLSCAFLDAGVHKKFSFYKDNRPRHVVLKVPRGFLHERLRIGENAKEQFYEYPGGAVFFIGLNVPWPSINQARGLVPYADTGWNEPGMYKGADEKGLFWKEIHIENFIVGYSHVPADRQENFERSLHSIRFK